MFDWATEKKKCFVLVKGKIQKWLLFGSLIALDYFFNSFCMVHPNTVDIYLGFNAPQVLYLIWSRIFVSNFHCEKEQFDCEKELQVGMEREKNKQKVLDQIESILSPAVHKNLSIGWNASDDF